MAPKPKAKAAAKTATKAKAKPKGLQLSAAQWKAYTAAYNASATAGFKALSAQLAAANRQRAIQSAAAGLQKGRLAAVHTLQTKVAAAHAAARTAAIARYAVGQSYRQSKLAMQNKALVARVYADYQRHVQVAARLQFTYKGEKAFLHTAVMSTLTTQQAVAIETAAFAASAKAAKAAATSTSQTATTKSATPSPAVARILANAAAAGLKAAKATPAGKAAPRPAHLPPAQLTEPFGDPGGRDCVAAAIASSLLLDTGCRLSNLQYIDLVYAIGPDAEIGTALEQLQVVHPWYPEDEIPRLVRASPDSLDKLAGGHVIGFQTVNGGHAALYLGAGLIASWKETLPLREVLEGTVEEAWDLEWESVG